MTGDKGFLSRWSRRKRAADSAAGDREETPPQLAVSAPAATRQPSRRGAGAAAPDPGQPAPGPAPDAEPESEEQILARLGLPDPDTLGKGDDFSRFLSAAVPEALRRRALRRLWRSNPALAVLDGLNDYDGDYTGGFVAPGNLRTAYEVGRGFAARVSEALQEGAAPETSDDVGTGSTQETTADMPDRRPESATTDAPREPAAPDAAPGSPSDPIDADPAPRATRRRMAFR